MDGIRNKIFERYKLDSTNVKATLLTRSLLWMSLGLFVIIFVAWLSSTNTSFFTFVLNFSVGTSWLFAWLINIVLIMALYFVLQNNKINIVVPISIYSAFAFYEGMFITSILTFTGTVDIVGDLLLYMMIPAAIFAIMGVMGYFNLVNFTKLIPFISFSMIGMLIFGLVLFLTNSWMVEMIYLFLGAAMFIIWIGIDIQIIGNTQRYFDGIQNESIKRRLAFMFGINLFIDFVNLLIIMIRLFNK